MERPYDLKAPLKIQVQPTNFCNLRCKFCRITKSDEQFKQELSLERWGEIAKEIKGLGPDRLVVVGEENRLSAVRFLRSFLM